MKLSQMDLNLLLVLEALLVANSVTSASKELGQTVSATSHALRRLREAFDDDLLVRQGNLMVRTPRAQALLEPLREHLQGLRGIIENADAFDPGHSRRRFVIASEDLFASSLLPLLMRKLAKSAPGIELDVIASPKLGINALADRVDIMVGPMSKGCDWTLRQPLLDDSYVCIAAKDLEIGEEGLTLNVYAAHPHVIVGVGERGPTYVDDELAKLDLSRRVVLRVPSFSSAQRAVEEAPLLATMPSIAVQASSALRIFPVPVSIPTLRYGQLWHARWQRDTGHAWLRSEIKEVAVRLTQLRTPIGRPEL